MATAAPSSNPVTGAGAPGPRGANGVSVGDSLATQMLFSDLIEGSSGAGTNNHDVIEAALALGYGTSPRPGRAYFPEGLYYVTGTIDHDTRVDLYGSGGGRGEPSTILRFSATNGTGIILHSSGTSPLGRAGAGGVKISGLGLLWNHSTIGTSNFAAKWAPSTAYTVGQIRVPRSRWHYKWGQAFICTAAGTSGTSEPSWPNSFPFSTTPVVDGAGTLRWMLLEQHGVDIRTAFCKVEGCVINGWMGNGININSSSGYTPQRNANLWRTQENSINQVGGHGLFVIGADANAGSSYDDSCIDARGFGYYDEADLRNAYYGFHNRDNECGSWAQIGSGVGGPVSFNPYSEGGAPPSIVKNYSKVYGGVLQNGFTGLYGGPPPLPWQANHNYVVDDLMSLPLYPDFNYICVVAGTSHPTTAPIPIERYRTTEVPTDANFSDGAGTLVWRSYEVNVPSTGKIDNADDTNTGRQTFYDKQTRAKGYLRVCGGNGEVIYFGGDGDLLNGGTPVALDGPWSLAFSPAWGGWALVRSGSSDTCVLTGPSQPKHGAGYMFFPKGFICGPDGASGGIRTTYGTSAPIAGNPPGAHGLGDRHVNTAPAVGQPKSWACITPHASLGTWISEGNL